MVGSRTDKKAIFHQRFDLVRKVIHQWDPYRLLESGSPGDEFDGEIMAVVRQIDRIHSATDASQVISRVFSSSFEPEMFQVEQCRDVGHKLYEALIQSDIIQNRG